MNHSDIQLRLYREMLIAGAALSVFCIFVNHISAFPMASNLKWLLLLCVSVFAFVFSYSKKYTENVMFGIFIFVICVFFPYAFMDSGGSSNNAIGYTFFLLIAVTYLFSNWKRVFLVCALIAVFIAMHIVEYYFPKLIACYPGWTQFMDKIIQIPMLLLITFHVILRFAREYQQVNKKLSVYASFDELTGLYNRRMFNRAIEKAENEEAETIQLALLDLDNFKKVNDQYGHNVGDEVLKKLAGLLHNAFGLERHIVSRWGGDEFAIIYYGEKKELADKLEDIRKEYEIYIYKYEETSGVSISIVSFEDYNGIAQVLTAADKQLYVEKMKKPC